MPGGIDFSTTLHDILEDDSLPLADDFSAGTRAALAGGTTMIVDNVVPKKGQSLVRKGLFTNYVTQSSRGGLVGL